MTLNDTLGVIDMYDPSVLRQHDFSRADEFRFRPTSLREG